MNGTTVRRSPGRKGTPQTEPNSKLPQTVADGLRKHVVLELESIDLTTLIFDLEKRFEIRIPEDPEVAKVILLTPLAIQKEILRQRK